MAGISHLDYCNDCGVLVWKREGGSEGIPFFESAAERVAVALKGASLVPQRTSPTT